jgi:peroxiredoxin
MDNNANSKGAGGAPGWLPKVMLLAGVFLMALALVGALLQYRAQSALNVAPGLPTSPAYGGPARVGATMADFKLLDTNGKQVKLSDYAGQAVLINTWATWCPPCRAEMPDLNVFYQKHRESGFVVLAVNAGETRDLAAGFANQLGLAFPILLDSDEYLVDSLGIRDFPTSILVGRDGKIKAVHVGMFTPDMLEKQILPLIR